MDLTEKAIRLDERAALMRICDALGANARDALHAYTLLCNEIGARFGALNGELPKPEGELPLRDKLDPMDSRSYA